MLFSQSLNCARLFAAPGTAAHQASLSFTISQSLLKLMSIESVMPSNHLVLCHPLLLLPSIFPSIRVFSNESALHTRWPKYCSFSFSIIKLKIKNLIANAGDVRHVGLIPGQGRCLGIGHGNPLQYSCLENSYGQRSMVGCSPWGCKESDMAE